MLALEKKSSASSCVAPELSAWDEVGFVFWRVWITIFPSNEAVAERLGFLGFH